MIVRRGFAAALLLGLCASTAQAGSDFNVTGTWTGTYSCKLTISTGQTLKSGAIPFTLDATQTGSLVSAVISVTAAGPAIAPAGFPRGSETSSPLCGTALGQSGKPGKGLLNFSAAAATIMALNDIDILFPGEFGFSAQLTEPNPKGLSGKASGAILIDSFVTLTGPIGPFIGGCKAKMQRTSNADPGLDPDLIALCANAATLLTAP